MSPLHVHVEIDQAAPAPQHPRCCAVSSPCAGAKWLMVNPAVEPRNFSGASAPDHAATIAAVTISEAIAPPCTTALIVTTAG